MNKEEINESLFKYALSQKDILTAIKVLFSINSAGYEFDEDKTNPKMFNFILHTENGSSIPFHLSKDNKFLSYTKIKCIFKYNGIDFKHKKYQVTVEDISMNGSHVHIEYVDSLSFSDKDNLLISFAKEHTAHSESYGVWRDYKNLDDLLNTQPNFIDWNGNKDFLVNEFKRNAQHEINQVS